MMRIVAIGESEFSLGFELAGVRSVRVEENAEQAVLALLDDESLGIIIMSQRLFDAVSADLRERLLRAIKPITVVLSDRESNEELRAMILKSIGVDLWKSEE